MKRLASTKNKLKKKMAEEIGKKYDPNSELSNNLKND